MPRSTIIGRGSLLGKEHLRIVFQSRFSCFSPEEPKWKVSKYNCLLSEVCEVSSQVHLAAKVHQHASKYRPTKLWLTSPHMPSPPPSPNTYKLHKASPILVVPGLPGVEKIWSPLRSSYLEQRIQFKVQTAGRSEFKMSHRPADDLGTRTNLFATAKERSLRGKADYRSATSLTYEVNF